MSFTKRPVSRIRSNTVRRELKPRILEKKESLKRVPTDDERERLLESAEDDGFKPQMFWALDNGFGFEMAWAISHGQFYVIALRRAIDAGKGNLVNTEIFSGKGNRRNSYISQLADYLRKNGLWSNIPKDLLDNTKLD